MKPLILITNDDGIYSPGLLAAAEAVVDLGELLICAPHTQQTGMGRSFPRTEDLGIIEKVPLRIYEKEVIAYSVHGSPAYAVAHGVWELADRLPDLCISGINYGENLGFVLSCSGTVGAALEAVSHGIPGIAVSKQIEMHLQRNNDFANVQWEVEKKIIKDMAEMLLYKGLPGRAALLNINVPQNATAETNYVWTRQSRQNYFPFQKPPKRSFEQPFQMPSTLMVEESTLEKDSDIYAIHVEHKISITPLTWDMTEETAFQMKWQQ